MAGIKTGFFIDKDFDKNDEDYIIENFYVTDRYSIENYYVSEACLNRIVKNELGISEGNQYFHTILSRYRSFQQSYHESTSLFNAWYYTIKNNGKECMVSLNDKLPNGFLLYDFENWRVEKKYTLEDINNKYSVLSYEVKSEEIEASKSILDKDPSKLYRGKYEFTCLIEFMKHIQDELNRKEKVPGELTIKPYKPQVSACSCLSLWAQYTDTDEKLKEYVKKRIKDVKS